MRAYARRKDELFATLAGTVLEVGAGTGANFGRLPMLQGTYRDLVPDLARACRRSGRTSNPLPCSSRACNATAAAPAQRLRRCCQHRQHRDRRLNAGVLLFGLHVSLAIAIPVAAAIGVICAAAALRFQVARWRDALAACFPGAADRIPGTTQISSPDRPIGWFRLRWLLGRRGGLLGGGHGPHRPDHVHRDPGAAIPGLDLCRAR